MASTKNVNNSNISTKSDRAWNWWTGVTVLIVGTIAFLIHLDAIFAPKTNNPAVLPDAVGKSSTKHSATDKS